MFIKRNCCIWSIVYLSMIFTPTCLFLECHTRQISPGNQGYLHKKLAVKDLILTWSAVTDKTNAAFLTFQRISWMDVFSQKQRKIRHKIVSSTFFECATLKSISLVVSKSVPRCIVKHAVMCKNWVDSGSVWATYIMFTGVDRELRNILDRLIFYLTA